MNRNRIFQAIFILKESLYCHNSLFKFKFKFKLKSIKIDIISIYITLGLYPTENLLKKKKFYFILFSS